ARHCISFRSTTPRPPRAPLFPYTTLFRSSPSSQAIGASVTFWWPWNAQPGVSRKSPRRIATGSPSTTVHTPSPSMTKRNAFCERSEEHTSELQSRRDLVCRLLLEKKNTPHRLAGGHVHLGHRAGHPAGEDRFHLHPLHGADPLPGFDGVAHHHPHPHDRPLHLSCH